MNKETFLINRHLAQKALSNMKIAIISTVIVSLFTLFAAFFMGEDKATLYFLFGLILSDLSWALTSYIDYRAHAKKGG